MKYFTSLVATIVLLALGLTALPPSSARAADSADDIATMVSRIQEYYLDQGDDIIIANGIYLARTSEALDYVESQNPDGSWSDVDYADRTSSANGKTWSPYIALYRMLALAHAYRDPDAAGFEDPAVLAASESALLYWDAVDPGNTNRWETEIGESIAMGRISIFLGDVLSPEAMAVALTHNSGKLDPAGANGAWRTSNYLFKAVATHDVEMITAGFATMVQTVAVDDSGDVNEAVQPDASFWAHGAQLYSEGYGMALFTMVAMWADVARGTSVAFTRDQLDTIAFYILDGTRWMIREEFGLLYLLYRPAKTIAGVTSYASEFLDPLDRMARTDALYGRDYRELAANIRGVTEADGQVGDKYFWRSEFLSHKRDDYAIFTAVNSSRTVGSEYRSTLRKDVGNEIVWSKAGVTAIHVTNTEYTALGPAFDWYHYPGSTVPYVKETSLGSAGRSGNAGSFTGGVSDGHYGAAVHSLDRADTQAQKSYFFFDDEMVAVGAGIQSTSTAEIHTTVNQVAAMDNASVNGSPVAAGTDADARDHASWAYNDKVGYVFPENGALTVSNKTQTGSYYGEESQSHDAFTLYLNHGVAPSDASYEYVVLPAATSEQTQAYAADPAVEVLRNDTDVQAARHGGLQRTMATFYRAGSLDLGDGRSLTVSQPAILILDESSGQAVVSIANPSQPGLLVDVSIDGGGDSSRGTFVLGSGPNLGKTVTAPLVAEGGAGSLTASGSASGHGPSLAGDGDQGTFWTSEGATPWLQKRLTAGSSVVGLEVDWADAFATRYLVQTSMDGVSWTAQKLVQEGAGGSEKVEFPAVAANFVRITPLSGADAYEVREVRAITSVNLALGAPTTASDGSGPDSATDGNLSSRWIADRTGSPDSSWLQVDLGSVQHIGAVRLWWEASYAKQYKIQVSADGSNWTDAYTTPSAGSDGESDLLAIDANARYVRMQTVARALSSYGVSVWEFEVFGNSAILDAPLVSTRPNLALNKPTTADSVYNNLSNIVPTMATDGSLSTKWSSNRPSGSAPYSTENWIQVDLGRSVSISQAVVDWESANSTDYRVEGSVDGEAWEQLAHVQNTGTGNHRRDTVDFATAQVQYVRVIGTPATKYGLNIWELEIYGGYSLTCDGPVSLDAHGSAQLTVNVSPLDGDDVFTAASVDPGVATVTSEGQSDGSGAVTFEIAAQSAGTTSVVVSHANGDEFVNCTVIVAVDAATLQGLVDQANGLNSMQYTSESWAPVIPALAAAKAVLASTGATQAEVDARADALRTAIEGLTEPPAPSVQVAGDLVVGGTITVTGSAFEPGTAVVIELRSDPVQLATATVGGDGTFSVTGTIPSDTPAGTHQIVVMVGGADVASQAITIAAADGGSTGGGGTGGGSESGGSSGGGSSHGGSLSSTGGDAAPMWAALALGITVLGAGSVLLIHSRRRTRG